MEAARARAREKVLHTLGASKGRFARRATSDTWHTTTPRLLPWVLEYYNISCRRGIPTSCNRHPGIGARRDRQTSHPATRGRATWPRGPSARAGAARGLASFLLARPAALSTVAATGTRSPPPRTVLHGATRTLVARATARTARRQMDARSRRRRRRRRLRRGHLRYHPYRHRHPALKASKLV